MTEPAPDCGEPAMPDWLPAEGKEASKLIVPQLVKQRMLTPLDVAALTGYCTAFAELQKATETLAREGRYFRQNGSKTRHPALGVQQKAWTALRQFAGELGLSVAARTRIHVQIEDDDSDDPLAKLLRAKADRFEEYLAGKSRSAGEVAG